MSNEPGGPAPVPDPYAVPDPAAAPVPPSGYEAVPPSGYEAVRTPVGETPPTYPYGAIPPPAANPYAQQPGAGDAPPAYGAPPGLRRAAVRRDPEYGAPQYGAPQYGAPQYGAPQYGAPGYAQTPPPYGAQPYGYGQPYAPPPTEGMAIASFVTSTAGLLFFGGLPGPVGLGLGIAALRRIRVNGKAGRGWAIAGIIIGAVGILSMLAIVAYIVFVIALIGSSGSGFWDEVGQGFEEGYDQGAEDSGSDQLPDFDLRTDLAAGTCLTTYSWEYDMADTEPVDCAVPHEAEVVGVITMSGPVSLNADDEFDSAYNDAWDECDQLTEGLLPDYFSNGNIELYYPHPDDFAAGSTSAYCVYYGDETGMTGSATAGTLELAASGTSS